MSYLPASSEDLCIAIISIILFTAAGLRGVLLDIFLLIFEEVSKGAKNEISEHYKVIIDLVLANQVALF